MFQCIDKEGKVVATYSNLSEAKTYWGHSAPNGKANMDENVREGEVTVFDENQNEIGSIKLPKGK